MTSPSPANGAAMLELEACLNADKRVISAAAPDFARTLLAKGFRRCDQGVWRSPDGMALSSYIEFLAPREAAHFLVNTSAQQSPTKSTPAPSGYRPSLLHRLNQANGATPDYGFDR